MKRIVPLLFIALIVPQLVFASWWNPFSWDWFLRLLTSKVETHQTDDTFSTSEVISNNDEVVDYNKGEENIISSNNKVSAKNTNSSNGEDYKDRPINKDLFIDAKITVSLKKNYDGVNYYRLDVTGAKNPKTKWYIDIGDCPPKVNIKVNGNKKPCEETVILNPNGQGNLEDVEITVENPTDNKYTTAITIKAYDENDDLIFNSFENIAYAETRPTSNIFLGSSDTAEEKFVLNGSFESNKKLISFYFLPEDDDVTLKELNVGLRYDSQFYKLIGFSGGVYLRDEQTGKIFYTDALQNVDRFNSDSKVFKNLGIQVQKGQKYYFSVLADINSIDAGQKLVNYWEGDYLHLSVDIDPLTGASDADLDKIWKSSNPIYKTIKIDVTNDVKQNYLG